MRIALLYPPPWKIPTKGEAPGPDGPPAEYREGDLDADFHQTPYGLFSLGAQALRAGHQVKVMNLSAFAWRRVEEVVRALDAPRARDARPPRGDRHGEHRRERAHVHGAPRARRRRAAHAGPRRYGL